MPRRKHYFGAQVLPLSANAVVCHNCGHVARIGQWPTGKRRKCSPGHAYEYPQGRRWKSGKVTKVAVPHG